MLQGSGHCHRPPVVSWTEQDCWWPVLPLISNYFRLNSADTAHPPRLSSHIKDTYPATLSATSVMPVQRVCWPSLRPCSLQWRCRCLQTCLCGDDVGRHLSVVMPLPCSLWALLALWSHLYRPTSLPLGRWIDQQRLSNFPITPLFSHRPTIGQTV